MSQPSQSDPHNSGSTSHYHHPYTVGGFAPSHFSSTRASPGPLDFGSAYSSEPFTRPESQPLPARDSDGRINLGYPMSGTGMTGPPMDAVVVQNLAWYVSDEDIIRASAQANVHLRHRDITFSEHKANGKSKGIVFIQTESPAHALALKSYFDTHELYERKPTTSLASSAHGNPFRTLPKDAPGYIPRGPGVGGPAFMTPSGGGGATIQSFPALAQQQQQPSFPVPVGRMPVPSSSSASAMAHQAALGKLFDLQQRGQP